MVDFARNTEVFVNFNGTEGDGFCHSNSSWIGSEQVNEQVNAGINDKALAKLPGLLAAINNYINQESAKFTISYMKLDPETQIWAMAFHQAEQDRLSAFTQELFQADPLKDITVSSRDTSQRYRIINIKFRCGQELSLILQKTDRTMQICDIFCNDNPALQRAFSSLSLETNPIVL